MNGHDASRKKWSTKSGTSATLEEINGGSLQRIADALEGIQVSLDRISDVARRVDRRLDRRSYPVKPG